MKLIIGLGNPGKKYENTRHNVGFIIADAIISNFQFPIFKTDKKTNAEISKGEIDGKRALVAKPATFMNDSGTPTQALLSFYKLTPADLIVIHDDKDILLGETRMQTGRGSAGHNGINSIIEHLGTKDFLRVRVGIAPSPTKERDGGEVSSRPIADTANFVLSKFTKEEQKILKDVIKNVVEEIKKLIK